MDLFAIEKSIPQSLVFDFIRRNKLEGGRLKIIVTGGQEAELALPKRGGSLIIMAAPLPVIPKQITLKPIKAPLFPGKLLSYMPRLYLRELAKPCDDCLLLGEGGEILETAVGNLYWELDGQLYTPDPDRLPIYFGVAIGQMKKVRRVVIRLDELPPEAKLFRINALGTSSVIHIDSVD
ncbi:MAG: hypothetical protein S4CHLAM81_11770 [Chlamydiales bacterium]|nr:hypothetical protein [Chlamydiales bacterium]MCH9635953.1 hypothetical protein [Chlamydiales bacterium]